MVLAVLDWPVEYSSDVDVDIGVCVHRASVLLFSTFESRRRYSRVVKNEGRHRCSHGSDSAGSLGELFPGIGGRTGKHFRDSVKRKDAAGVGNEWDGSFVARRR